MQIFTWDELINNQIKTDQKISFTTGVFDGIHLGHMQLLRKLFSQQDTVSVITTFRNNPLQILNESKFRGDILTLDKKTQLLEQLGCDILILIDFSLEFSKLSGREFFDYIKNQMKLCHVVLGHDHKIGNMGDTTAEAAKKMLQKESIKVDIVEPFLFKGVPVSSTRIRKAIISGDFLLTEKLLGRKYSLDLRTTDLTIEGNYSLLRKINIKQVVPFSGKYAVKLRNGEKTFATEIKITEDSIMFGKIPKFKIESLTFSCL